MTSGYFGKQWEKITYNLKGIGYVLIIIIYLGILFFPAFKNKGALLQTDQPVWAAATHVWFNEVVPSQQWIWGTVTDRSSAGIVLAEGYSANIIMLCLFRIFFSDALAVKITMITCAFLFMLAMFFLATRYLSRNYSLICSILVFSPIFDNLVSGMWYNYLALACALGFWYTCDKYFNQPDSYKFPLFATIFFGSSIYSHPVGSIMSVSIWSAYFMMFLFLNPKNKLKYKYIAVMITVPIIGALLAAPQIFAVLGMAKTSAAPTNPLTSVIRLTEPLEFFRRLLIFRVWGASNPSLLVKILMVWEVFVVGFLSVIGMRKLFSNKPSQVIPVCFLFVMNIVILSKIFIYIRFYLGDGIVNLLADYYDRFQLVTQIYIALLSVLGIFVLGQYAGAINTRRKFLQSCFGQIIGMLTLIIISMHPLQKVYIDSTEQLSTIDTSPIRNSLMSFWAWVRENVDASQERIYIQDTYGELHWNTSKNPESWKSHAFALTSIYTDACQIGGWSSLNNRFAQAHELGGIMHASLDEVRKRSQWASYEKLVAEELKSINCKYVVAVTKEFDEKMMQISYMSQVASFDVFKVYKNLALNSAWVYRVRDDKALEVKKYSPARYELNVAGFGGDLIHICMAYHPAWKAFAGKTEIILLNNNELIEMVVPTGNVQLITLVYTIDRIKPLLLFCVGIISFIALYIVLAKTQKGK